MGFFRDLFHPDERQDRPRKSKTAGKQISSASLSSAQATNGSSSSYTNGTSAPTSPTSVNSRASGGNLKRSSSPPPPVPPLPALPSDAFTLQETITIRREREREKERLREERLNGSNGGPASYSMSYSGSNDSHRAYQPPQQRPSPSPLPSPQPSHSYRATGLVAAAVAEERESISGASDDASIRRHERELARDYEAAVSRQMERLGSSSSFGGTSVVSGLSGVRGWGLNPVPQQPFQDTVDGGERLKIIIVGSGFAGLATAIACARQGYEVTVVERGSGLSPHGDLITLGSNCTRLLARWGLFHDMWRRSARGGWWLLKSHTGEMLGGQDLRDFPQVYGAPLMQGHRAQYLGVLGVEARMQQVGYKPNTEVVEFLDDDHRPAIITARGERMEADCIVVCDGVNSYAKAFLAPELGGALENLRKPEGEENGGEAAEPVKRSTPDPDEGKKYSVHRAAMMSDRLRENPKTAGFLDGKMRTFVGPDSHLKIAPLDDNRQVSFTYLSRSRYQASTNWRDRRPVKEVTDTLEAEGWDESVIEAVKAFRTCLNWAVSEGPPSDRWVTESGKIVLIGDAVHALSPLSFQGGSQAIEDGASLAVCLALSGGKPEDIPRAFKAFEIMRKDRVAEAQIRGTKQRHLWHSYYDNKSPASLDLNITEAYHHDAELHALASFERTVQTHLDGERDFTVDPLKKKACLRKLEIGGRAQREAEADMADPDVLWDRGGGPRPEW
ncbi:hypothetical protein JCM8547_002568 [Rhodosporidiobolus lusitaniae]